MQCISTDRNRCPKDAEFVVKKKVDLSHRQAEYCADHAEPYKAYPDDFSVDPLNTQ